MEISNEEYKRIMALGKVFNNEVKLPQENETRDYTLHAEETKEEFQLNVERKNLLS